MKSEQVIIEPLITEKSTLGREQGKYLFKVHPWATKIDVKRAVEEVFKVKVTAVNTVNMSGKRRVMGRFVGRTSSWKKAYVALAAGQRIERLEA